MIKKRSFKKLLKTFFILFLVISWTFTGLPRIPFINFPPKIQRAQAAPIAQYTGGLLVFADGTTGTPKYKTFDDTTGFGATQSATSVGASAIEWIRVAASPVNDEWIIATRDAADDIKVQVCTGVDGGVSCSSVTTVTATAGTHGFRNYDVAYEQTSGDALLVYGTATVDELRKIEWTGGAWTSDAAITTTRTAGAVEWVELTSRPASDQIGIAYSDTADDVSAYRWSGTAVGDEATAVITAVAVTTDVRKFDISFEGASGDMLVAALYTTGGAVAYGALSGTTWTITTNTTPDIVTNFLDMQEPGAVDYIAIETHGALAASNLSEGYEWTGSVISDSNFGDATAANWAIYYQLAAVSYMSSTYYGVAVLSGSAGADDIAWWTMSSAGTITEQAVNARTRGASSFIDLFDYPNADKVLLLTADANSDLWADTWAGAAVDATAWANLTSGGALETALGSATTDVVDFAFRLAPVPTTTLSTGTNPGNSTIAPGGSITSVNGFTLTTSAGTDAITAITVNLSTNNGVGTLTITDGADTVLGSIGGGIGTGIVTGSNSISITSTNATTGGTAFKVKVTPLSHANMPAPAGGEYAITGVVTDWTGTNTKAGQATDTSDTVTIDNLSPTGATSVSGVAGNAAVTLNWTSSASTDFNTTSGSVIYRWTGGTAGTEVPAEGSTATIGGINGTATTACVVSSAISAVLSKIDGTGGSAECTTTALTNGQAYTYKAFQKDTNGNYDAGVSIGTFTPSAAAAYLTQNNFRFYLTANSVTLTDPWPSGTLDLGEKAALTQLPVQNLALVSGDKIRIKINFGVTVTNLTATTQAFQLEYSAAEDCTTASSWTAVDGKAGAGIWRLYDEASIGDSTVEVNNLGDSTTGAEGYYSEINPSGTNPNAVGTGQYSEWDWPLEDNGAAENTTYCFRMAKSGGGALDSYGEQSYPKLTTAPGVSILMRHGSFFQNQAEKGFFWAN